MPDATPARPITRETIEIALGIVAAETWPARYKLHKYWGRKPANVVDRYIQLFTKRDDLVLDPFAGSGVTLVEGARLGRRVAGFDINPFAVRLTNAMLHPPAPARFEAAAEAVVRAVARETMHLYTTTCERCRGPATVRSVGWVETEPHEVRYRCSACRSSAARPPSARDRALATQEVSPPDGAPDDDIFFGWEMQKLRRKGVRRWSDLFTRRNFAAAARLRAAILEVEDAACREWLLLSLTASLAQFTRMIADFRGDAGGPSWKINCYWLPKKWQELNPLWYFENRVGKSLDAVRDLMASGAPFGGGLAAAVDSRALPLRDDSVDYVFTDPPYGGEGIQYGELSMLWCLWIGERQDLGAEVAFNPYRSLDQTHYADGLARVFRECFRVLRPGKWMTVTFANKDPQVWDALMAACKGAGFALVTAAPMKRSAPSVTETNMHTAPKADLVLTFQKPTAEVANAARSGESAHYSLEAAVERIARALRASGTGDGVHDVFDRVTVDWFSWYYETGSRPDAVQPTLARVEAALRRRGRSDGAGAATVARRSSVGPLTRSRGGAARIRRVVRSIGRAMTVDPTCARSEPC